MDCTIYEFSICTYTHNSKGIFFTALIVEPAVIVVAGLIQCWGTNVD